MTTDPTGEELEARAVDLELVARESELRVVTDSWTVPSVSRTYRRDEDGQEDFEDDELILRAHGYRPQPRTSLETATFERTANPSSASPGASMTRRYFGKPDSAFESFQADARVLARQFWLPASQSYIPGTWSTGAWIVAFLAMILLIGLLVVAYMIVARPAGELVVIYEYRPPAAVAAREPKRAAGARRLRPAAPRRNDAADEIRKLARLRDENIITEDEFQAQKRRLLGL